MIVLYLEHNCYGQNIKFQNLVTSIDAKCLDDYIEALTCVLLSRIRTDRMQSNDKHKYKHKYDKISCCINAWKYNVFTNKMCKKLNREITE